MELYILFHKHAYKSKYLLMGGKEPEKPKNTLCLVGGNNLRNITHVSIDERAGGQDTEETLCVSVEIKPRNTFVFCGDNPKNISQGMLLGEWPYWNLHYQTNSFDYGGKEPEKPRNTLCLVGGNNLRNITHVSIDERAGGQDTEETLCVSVGGDNRETLLCFVGQDNRETFLCGDNPKNISQGMLLGEWPYWNLHYQTNSF
ncbi:hypothetical protein RCL_jg3818.t2 [Rhizophagus clarus]|uniref:Uncharacterized protein n=2 Tax=Rhizophagus clarus TaxID=94130 RepID=A0A8H3KUP1_9GLOM|nr:hypothetical protein RCL_jg3818.t2 [Rhizophagus clarus]